MIDVAGGLRARSARARRGSVYRHRGRRPSRRRRTCSRGRHWLVGGPVRVLPLPADLPFAEHRLTPRAAARARSPSAAGGASPASRPATPSTARTSTSPSWPSSARTAWSSIPWSARPRTTTCRRPCASRPTRRCWNVLPGGAHAPRRLPRRHALRGPARGALPRAGAQELRHRPAHRRPRPRGRGPLLRPLRRPAASSTASPPRSWASPPLKLRAHVLLPRLRRAGLARAPARTTRRARLELSGTQGARDPARGRRTCPRSSRGRRSRRSCARTSPDGAPSPATRVGRVRPTPGRLHRLVHRPLRRGQEHAGRGAARASCRPSARSRSWTATRCAPTSRRASASPRRTATRTSAASASWRACWPARRGGDHRRHLALRGRPATRCGGCAEAGRAPVRRGVRGRVHRRAGRARREGALQEGAGRRDRALHGRLRSLRGAGGRRTSSCAATARRSRRASTASWAALEEPRPASSAVRGRRRALVSEPLFPVFLKLAGRRSWWWAADRWRRRSCPPCSRPAPRSRSWRPRCAPEIDAGAGRRAPARPSSPATWTAPGWWWRPRHPR